MLWHRVEEMLEKNRLLMATIAGFLGLYCVAAYVLVSRGLEFISKMPLSRIPKLGSVFEFIIVRW